MMMLSAYRIVVIYYLLAVWSTSFGGGRYCHAEMEAKWTPNEQDEGGGPLPLSQNQREQLLKLHQTILSSPDPQATLQQVADSNDMNVNELADLLNRNYAFFQQQNPSGLAGNSRNVWTSVSVVLASLFHSALRHPRTASLLLVTFLAAFHLIWMSPRTGVVLSNSRSIVSRGPTTLFTPPVLFLKSASSSFWQQYENRRLSIRNLDAWKDAQEKITPQDHDSVQVHKVKGFKHVVVSQTTVVSLEEDVEENNDDEVQHQQQRHQNWENRLEWTWEHASRILAMREITEWVSDDLPSMRLVVVSSDSQTSEESNRRPFCSLVVEKLGDWRRYAIIPFQVTHEDDSSLTLTTMKGAQFDGQIHIAITEQNGDDDEEEDEGGSHGPVVAVRVSLIVPKDSSKALSNYWAQTIVRGISESVSTSIRTHTCQSQVRSSQSASVRHAAGYSAKRKRHARLEKEALLEEMAADRRRRWQRQNPNAGHYRPSGERMRSPKNAIAFQ
jgi:hypothetical protein